MTRLLLPFTSTDATLANAGGKGQNLVKLAHAGLPVPPGFIISTAAYRAFVAANKLKTNPLTIANGELTVDEASNAIRAHFHAGVIPADLAASILTAYHDLASSADYRSPITDYRLAVAVRSSATAEDLPDLSFAGQQDTFLNVMGDDALLAAVIRCWSSLWTARAITYRQRNGIAHDDVALAVVVQAMVESEASGVLFTANPLTGKRSEVVIDATLGLGEALVSGQVEPDQIVLDPVAGTILRKQLGAKATMIRGQAGGGVKTVQQDAAAQQALSDAALIELARLGKRVEQELYAGEPQDIEWAWAGERLYLLQSRAITSLYPLPYGMPAAPLQVLFSMNHLQGMLDPFTPVGQDALVELYLAISRVLGRDFAADTQREVVVAGERVYANLTPLLRGRRGRRLLLNILGAVEPGAQQALQATLADIGATPTARGARTGAKYCASIIMPTMRAVRRGAKYCASTAHGARTGAKYCACTIMPTMRAVRTGAKYCASTAHGARTGAKYCASIATPTAHGARTGAKYCASTATPTAHGARTGAKYCASTATPTAHGARTGAKYCASTAHGARTGAKYCASTATPTAHGARTGAKYCACTATPTAHGARTGAKYCASTIMPTMRAVRTGAKYCASTMGRMLRLVRQPDAGRRQVVARVEQELATFQARTRHAATPAARITLARDAFDLVRVIFPYLSPAMALGIGSFILLRRLARLNLGDESLALEVARGLPHNVTTEMDLRLWVVAEVIAADAASAAHFAAQPAATLAQELQAGRLPIPAQAALAAFMERYGMRGLAEIDLGRPRWRDDPTHIIQAVQSYLAINDPTLAPDAVFARGAERAETALAELVQRLRGKGLLGPLKAALAARLGRLMRSLAGLRETPKFTVIRVMGMVRDLLLANGETLAAAGVLNRADDVMFLHLDELETLAHCKTYDTAAWQALVTERRQAYGRELLRKPIPRLLLSDGTAFYAGMVATAGADDDATLVGSPVSPSVVEGTVRVVFDPRAVQLTPGDILVCPGTDPSWTPLFLAAGGLVMEVGGLMTHGSVVAREYGIPAVVGVHEATTRLHSGQRVRVDGSAGRVTVISEA